MRRTARWGSMIAALFLAATVVGAEEASRTAPSSRVDVAESAHRIAGATAILSDLRENRASRALDDAARAFEKAVGGRTREGVRPAWDRVVHAFDGVRRSNADRDGRVAFVMRHLETEIAILGEQMAHIDPPREPGRHAFVANEVCIGEKGGEHACPVRRDEMHFHVPSGVSMIRRIEAQWRDFGRDGRAEILLNGKAVWSSDVGASWDHDANDVNLVVQGGSQFTIRSATGDPIWIRKLEIVFDAPDHTMGTTSDASDVSFPAQIAERIIEIFSPR